MDKKHTYDYEIDLESDVAPARVLRMVRPGSRVLEIGAGPGSITRHLTGTLGCSVVAVEIDPSAIALLEPHAEKVHQLDLNDAGWSTRIHREDGLFDYVIAADVLEHVLDPLAVLSAMASLLVAEGSVVLSLPHVGHSVVAACLIDEDFEYRPWGLLDRTHIRFFGIRNIQNLINSAGLSIDKAEFVVRTPLMTEFAARWKRLPDDIKRSLQRNRYGNVYQVVTCSSRQSAENSGINLLDITAEPPPPAVVKLWTEMMVNQGTENLLDIRSTLVAEDWQGPTSRFYDRFLWALKKQFRKSS